VPRLKDCSDEEGLEDKTPLSTCHTFAAHLFIMFQKQQGEKVDNFITKPLPFGECVH
jgi:hypothetical protein